MVGGGEVGGERDGGRAAETAWPKPRPWSVKGPSGPSSTGGGWVVGNIPQFLLEGEACVHSQSTHPNFPVNLRGEWWLGTGVGVGSQAHGGVTVARGAKHHPQVHTAA